MTAVIVRHNFETAHRLPFLGGKCTNLHGHSWWAEVTLDGKPDRHGVLLDFGKVKADLRSWIDLYLDHGTMLGADDPLVAPLVAAGCKVFTFDPLTKGLCAGSAALYGARDLAWPTVENVAELIRRVAVDQVDVPGAPRVLVSVRVRETHVNEAVAP